MCKSEYPTMVAFCKLIRRLTGPLELPWTISIFSTNSGSIGRRPRLGIPKSIAHILDGKYYRGPLLTASSPLQIIIYYIAKAFHVIFRAFWQVRSYHKRNIYKYLANFIQRDTANLPNSLPLTRLPLHKSVRPQITLNMTNISN